MRLLPFHLWNISLLKDEWRFMNLKGDPGDTGDSTKVAPVTLSLWNFGRFVIQKKTRKSSVPDLLLKLYKNAYGLHKDQAPVIQFRLTYSSTTTHSMSDVSFHFIICALDLFWSVVRFQVELLTRKASKSHWSGPHTSEPPETNHSQQSHREWMPWSPQPAWKTEKNKGERNLKFTTRFWRFWCFWVPRAHAKLVPRGKAAYRRFSVLRSMKCSSTGQKKHVNVWAFTCLHTKFGNLAWIIVSASISGGIGGIGGIELNWCRTCRSYSKTPQFSSIFVVLTVWSQSSVPMTST